MENAAEALKIAFAVTLFVMALSLSMSSFSQATRAVDAVILQKDKESKYTYVEPSPNLSRTVGIETVVSTMYRARTQNIQIYFFKSDGKTPYELYIDLDDNGVDTGERVSSIDPAILADDEKLISIEEQTEFLNVLLGGNNVDNWTEIQDKYQNKLIYTEGLYEELKEATFEERLGEYDQGTGTTKTTKRIITYIIQ